MKDLLKETAVRCLMILSAGLLVVPNADADADGCPTGLTSTTAMRRHGDLCYQFVSEEKYWHDARRYCFQNGGRLVKIDNSETNSFIVNTLNSLWWRNNGVWIGLHDTNREMEFQWTGFKTDENEPLGAWTNWGRGHPGAFLHSFRDCVRMVREEGQWKWHETPCSTLNWHYRFICEYKAVSNLEVEQSTLTQRILSSEMLQEKSTNSLRLTTAPSNLSTKEQSEGIEAHADETEKTLLRIEVDLNSSEETQRTPSNLTALDNGTPAFHEDFIEKLAIIDGLPAVASRMSDEKTEKLDEGQRNEVRLTLSLSFSLFAACAFLAIAFLIYRRRKAKLAAFDSCDDNERENKMAKQNQITKQSAVENFYVIGDATKSVHFVRKFPGDERQVVQNCSSDSDDSETGRDAPKATNLYDEISGGSEKAETEHIYESLDKCAAKIQS